MLNGYSDLTLGSDPEFFFVKNGKVIPSTQVSGLPKSKSGSIVVSDGFQGELNPRSNHCRAVSGLRVRDALLQAELYADSVGAKISTEIGYTIDDETWKSTDSATKRFGCNPTLNIHTEKHRLVTGLREKFRCAGGHIHIGSCLITNNREIVPKLIRVLDVLVGNTFVMLDRDPLNAKRRKFYGRAGEYREKVYGVEYRVLSNFWLKSYTLYSMAGGLVKNSLAAVWYGWADELLEQVDQKKIREAINNNDYELAYQNWSAVYAFLKRKGISSTAGLDNTNIDTFDKFLKCNDVLKAIDCKTEEEQKRSWDRHYWTDGIGMERFLEMYSNS